MRRFDIGMIAPDRNALRIGKRVLELGGLGIDSHSDVFLSDNEVLIQLRAKPGFSTEQECCTATLAALRLLAVLAVLAAKARLASAAVQHSCRGSLLFGHTLFSEDLNDLPRVPVATFRLFLMISANRLPGLAGAVHLLAQMPGGNIDTHARMHQHFWDNAVTRKCGKMD